MMSLPTTGYLYLGMVGWTGKYLKGDFYPPSLRPTQYLRFYSSHFNMVEVESTLGQLPHSMTLDNWYLNTPPRFLFCPHFPVDWMLEVGNKEKIGQFFDRLELLREKLGPVILDFTRFEKKGVVERLSWMFSQLPDEHRYVTIADDSNREILGRQLAGIKAKDRIILCEKLSGYDPVFPDSFGSFNYWHLYLDGEVNKKFASRVAEGLGEIISELVPNRREIFLVLESSMYEGVRLVREHLLKFLGNFLG